MNRRTWLYLVAATLATGSAFAADQSQPGSGNAEAARIASPSKVAQAAVRYVTDAAQKLRDPKLRRETLDALGSSTCVRHRAGLSRQQKQTILMALVSAGFVSASDANNWGPGALNGVFPPLVEDGSTCPTLPQSFLAAPGGGFHGHHSYPGGLALHTAMNMRSARSLADNYSETCQDPRGGLDQDLIVAAPLWHDWAKPMVFQWNADGSEFAQLSIAGTGSHHVLSLAETMARGLPPALVVAQASAHSTPTGGGETTVVGYIWAAAIIAQLDPVAGGYLVLDKQSKHRLPAFKHLADIDLLAAGQSHLLAEYALDNMADSDWPYAEPAMAVAETLLKKLAPRFGHDPTEPTYNTAFRNPVLSEMTAERIHFVFQRDGLEAVAKLLASLKTRGRI